MTRNLEVDYARPVPSGVPIRMEGKILSSEGRKHWVQARILNSVGSELALGKGLFIEVKPRVNEDVYKRQVPGRWHRRALHPPLPARLPA